MLFERCLACRSLLPRTATGDDTYILCEINVSCVTPFPHTAPPEVARLVYERLRAPTKGIA
jgi:hypothetical protein